MADSTATPACALCGGPLDEHDLDRTCHDCRSPKEKIADLDIAIRASGDNPERIRDWPVIRHLLRKRFGEDRSDTELWERCTDWLRAEGRLTPNDCLLLPLNYLQWLLEHGFIQPDQQAGNKKLEALHTFQRELESWNCSSSPSETGYVVEDVPIGHPLDTAVVALQPFYGGALPKPALGNWRTFLKLARNDDETAEDQAELLLEWVNGEIAAESDDALPKSKRANSPSPKSKRANSQSRVKASSAYDYAMERIPNAHAMTAPELFDAIKKDKDGEAAAMLPPTAESFTKYLNDCGIRLKKGGPKAAGGSVVRRSDL